MSFTGEHIWIIGASSGIGRALSQKLAELGATLILSARREEELNTLNRELGNRHYVRPLDVTDSKKLETTANEISDQVQQIDRIIFMAADYTPVDINDIKPEDAKRMVEINLLGAIYTTSAVLPVLEKQSKSQLVLCSSVAAYIGLPGGQPYSASKAAVTNFAETLYTEAPRQIDIKLISPGFVETPLTDKNSFNMPMIMKPDEAAQEIANGLKETAFEIHFPKKFTRRFKVLRTLPYSWAFALIKKF